MIQKESITFHSSQSLAAGAADLESSWEDLRQGHGCGVLAKITNGATAPSTAARIRVEVSPDDGTTVYAILDLAGPEENNGVRVYRLDIPRWAMYARVVFKSGTAQAVTVQADGMNISALA